MTFKRRSSGKWLVIHQSCKTNRYLSMVYRNIKAGVEGTLSYEHLPMLDIMLSCIDYAVDKTKAVDGSWLELKLSRLMKHFELSANGTATWRRRFEEVLLWLQQGGITPHPAYKNIKEYKMLKTTVLIKLGSWADSFATQQDETGHPSDLYIPISLYADKYSKDYNPHGFYCARRFLIDHKTYWEVPYVWAKENDIYVSLDRLAHNSEVISYGRWKTTLKQAGVNYITLEDYRDRVLEPIFGVFGNITLDQQPSRLRMRIELECELPKTHIKLKDYITHLRTKMTSIKVQ